MGELGVMTGMQPAFIGPKDMEQYRKLLGRERLERIHPYRTVLDHGIVIGGGSDSPVTPYAPINGILAATNHPNPAQQVTRMEAFQMFTTSAAFIGFEEECKGRIREGLLADLIVIDNDPLHCTDEELNAITINIGIRRWKTYTHH